MFTVYSYEDDNQFFECETYEMAVWHGEYDFGGSYYIVDEYGNGV